MSDRAFLGRRLAEMNSEILSLLRRGLSPEDIADATFEAVELVQHVRDHAEEAVTYYRFYPPSGRWLLKQVPVDEFLPTPKEIETETRLIRARW